MWPSSQRRIHPFSTESYVGLLLLSIHSDGESEQTLVCVGDVEFPFSPDCRRCVGS